MGSYRGKLVNIAECILGLHLHIPSSHRLQAFAVTGTLEANVPVVTREEFYRRRASLLCARVLQYCAAST